jgi:hypothetical protein
VADTVDLALNSITWTILALFLNVFSLFYVEIKMIFIDKHSEPAIIIANEIIFFILSMEFFCLVLFQKEYIGSFFFYLDFFGFLSMIPDSDLIMTALVSLSSDLANDKFGTIDHLVRASSASQAGARYYVYR